MSVSVGPENDSAGREIGHSLENKRVIGLFRVANYSARLVPAPKEEAGPTGVGWEVGEREAQNGNSGLNLALPGRVPEFESGYKIDRE